MVIDQNGGMVVAIEVQVRLGRERQQKHKVLSYHSIK